MISSMYSVLRHASPRITGTFKRAISHFAIIRLEPPPVERILAISGCMTKYLCAEVADRSVYR